MWYVRKVQISERTTIKKADILFWNLIETKTWYEKETITDFYKGRVSRKNCDKCYRYCKKNPPKNKAKQIKFIFFKKNEMSTVNHMSQKQ